MINTTLLVSPHDKQIREHIYQLRYDVLVKEQGKRPEYADHVNQVLKEPLDENCFLFAASQIDDVIGTCRVNYVRDFKDPFYRAAYHLAYFEENHLADKTGVISRFILHPSYRGTSSFKLMVKAVFKALLENDLSILLIDCALPLVPFYKKLGFLAYGVPFTHKDGMVVAPMVLDANNKSGLLKINSVLLTAYPESFCINEQIKDSVCQLVEQAMGQELEA
jgi:predicted GNAT family N-acyltransferase